MSPTRLWPDECSSGEGGLLQAPGAAGCQRTASLRQPCLFLLQDRAHLGNPGVCGQHRVPETPAGQGQASRVPRAWNLRRVHCWELGKCPTSPGFWLLSQPSPQEPVFLRLDLYCHPEANSSARPDRCARTHCSLLLLPGPDSLPCPSSPRVSIT